MTVNYPTYVIVDPALYTAMYTASSDTLTVRVPDIAQCKVPPRPPVDLFGVTFTMQRHSPRHWFVTLDEPGKSTSLLISDQSDPIATAKSILQMVTSHNLMRVTIEEAD